ncbi:unnamed protein product [Phaeothamnion confervicola]
MGFCTFYFPSFWRSDLFSARGRLRSCNRKLLSCHPSSLSLVLSLPLSDEVAAIVGDVGSHTSKFGYAGEDLPKHVFDTIVGFVPGAAEASPEGAAAGIAAAVTGRAEGQHLVGDDISFLQTREGLELRSPLVDGLVADWDALERVWRHGFRRMSTQPSAHPILAAEASWSSRPQRQRLMQLMFESFDVPALYVAKTGTLAAFSAGRATALVCDCGHSSLAVVPVVDGYVLNKGIQRSARGGDWLTHQALEHLTKTGPVVPRYAARLRRGGPGGRPAGSSAKSCSGGGGSSSGGGSNGGAAGAAAAIAGKVLLGVHPSFATYAINEVAQDLKEGWMMVPPRDKEDAAEALSDFAEDFEQPDYELPDGTKVVVAPVVIRTPEVIFDSKATGAAAAAAGSAAGTAAAAGGGAVSGTAGGSSAQQQRALDLPLQQLVHAALAASDADARREMCGNMLLSGGSSLFPGMPERLAEEAARLLPSALRVKVLAPQERRFAAWVGGSILATLGTFQQLWLSRAEYNELGPDAAQDRFGG